MQELDQWTESTIIEPLLDAAFDADAEVLTQRRLRIKQALRQKMLESYRNGQQAGPRSAKPSQKGGR